MEDGTLPNKDIKKHVKKHSAKPNSNNSNKPSDSITVVNFRLDGPRVACSFKCNKKLWKAFVLAVKAQGLSVCHVLEPMIYGWLTAKVYLSNTIKPIKIENITIERAVRRVRRYAVEADESRGIYCVLKDRTVPFDEVKLLDCYWKLSCPNVHCWNRVKGLIMQLRGSVNE